MDVNICEMEVNGNILLDKKGSLENINKDKSRQIVCDFVSMVTIADECRDSLYYDCDEWANFYAKCFSPNDSLWKDVGEIVYSTLYSNSNPVFKPIDISEEKFESKSEPRAKGGFRYEECIDEDYLYDKNSIEKWHLNWFKRHPEKIDWSKANNDIFPCPNKIIEFLCTELNKYKKDPSLTSKLETQDRKILIDTNISQMSPNQIVSMFYSFIMDHKDESSERIAYSIEIGSAICEMNYYNREKTLEVLNKNNKHIVRIYSIIKDGKYQFLSIDKKHGRFELCNDKGEHICEVMFNGDKVANSQDSNHSILCGKEWKRNKL